MIPMSFRFIGKHRKSGPRQAKALRRWMYVVSAVVLLVLTLGLTELGLHGWSTFVDRPPGVGSTEPLAAEEPETGVEHVVPQPLPKPAPTTTVTDPPRVVHVPAPPSFVQDPPVTVHVQPPPVVVTDPPVVIHVPAPPVFEPDPVPSETIPPTP